MKNTYTIMCDFGSSQSSKINPQITELFNLNFQLLEVVYRGGETQLQVTENWDWEFVWFVKCKSQFMSVF